MGLVVVPISSLVQLPQATALVVRHISRLEPQTALALGVMSPRLVVLVAPQALVELVGCRVAPVAQAAELGVVSESPPVPQLLNPQAPLAVYIYDLDSAPTLQVPPLVVPVVWSWSHLKLVERQ